MSEQSKLHAVFKSDGALAQAIQGFSERSQQLEMALAIESAIQQNKQLVAEAGTGTGKTFAYLVPALLSGGKVIISTGTKTLQDQLFNRDLPNIRDALKVPVTVSMLKGRSNYVCHYHLARANQEGRFASREDAQYLPVIQAFAENSSTGDKAELTDVPENATVWQHVTSTRDNCLGQECNHYKECFVMEARKKALAADVVVVNHHLFFADVMLRDEGVAELLPSANTVIFDTNFRKWPVYFLVRISPPANYWS
jgi:ATP-dependent DNA helicase DinG